MHRTTCLWISIAAASAGCAPPERPVVTFAGKTMGTEYSVKVVVKDGEAGEPTRSRLAGRIQEALEKVDAAMSTWRPESELSRFNAHAETTPFHVSRETLEVFELSRRISEATGGAFDVTVGPLVDAWGFGPPGQPGAVPPEDVLAESRARVGYTKLEISLAAGTVAKARPDVRCDLSAVAKGYAVDRVAGALVEAGFREHVVEVGGEVRATGLNARREPWRVAVEKPISADRQLGRIVPLSGLAVATSGDYRNFVEIEGRMYSHIIDPRTRRPAEHGLASASVVRPTCAEADAYATAMVVLGPDEGYRLAEKLDLAVLFIVRGPDGAFVERTTPAFDRLVAGR